MKDGRGIDFSGERYIGEAIEATRGSWVVLYVQYAVRPCDVVTKNSPGRAVKPAARQPVGRGQIVGSCKIIFRRSP